MATNVDCFFLNDNQESVTVDNSQTVYDNQYSNLNLNQNLKCLDVSPIQSNSKSYNNKNYGKPYCCSPKKFRFVKLIF
jgi:hypothetical protein